MTDSRDEGYVGKVEGPLQLEIVPPEGAVIGILAGQGTQEPREYRTVLWTPPEGTTRVKIGQGTLATFWRVTLPDGRQLLEVHAEMIGLSVLYDDGEESDFFIG